MMIQQITSSDNPSNIDQASRKKLMDAAQQFEGMLLQEMLKPLRSGQGGDEGGGGEDDSGNDTINSFGVEAVAKAISQGGGLGIARQVIQQVSSEHDKTHTPIANSSIAKE
jgi:Rod binding domain-containing protein